MIFFFILTGSRKVCDRKTDIVIYLKIYIIVYIIIYTKEQIMAKVLLSLPDEVLKEIDDYRNKKGLKKKSIFYGCSRYFLYDDKKRDEYF